MLFFSVCFINVDLDQILDDLIMVSQPSKSSQVTEDDTTSISVYPPIVVPDFVPVLPVEPPAVTLSPRSTQAIKAIEASDFIFNRAMDLYNGGYYK